MIIELCLKLNIEPLGANLENINILTLQKCSDTNRDYIIVEIIDKNHNCVADIAVNENIQKIEINFYQGLTGKTVNFDEFQKLLSDAKKIVDEDFKS